MIPSLRPDAYFLESTFDAEQCGIFSRCWTMVGLDDELANHHDFITREIAGASIFVQNFAGKLVAFRNVCSHRHAKIHCQESGNRPLQCTYHGWAYDATGFPIGIPERPRFDGLDAAELNRLRLPPLKVGRCGRLVFVAPATIEVSLADYLGPLFSEIEAWSNACQKRVAITTMSVGANWKVAVENTLESYHVNFVHADSFRRLGAHGDDFEFHGDHSSWRATVNEVTLAGWRKVERYFQARPIALPGYVHHFVFPNFTIASTFGATFSVQTFAPVSASETRFTTVLFETGLKEGSAASQQILEVISRSAAEFNQQVFEEDRVICERVQQGITSACGIGVLSDEETRVARFQQHYSDWMKRQEASS